MQRAIVPVVTFLGTAVLYAALSIPELATRPRPAPTPHVLLCTTRAGVCVAYDADVAVCVGLTPLTPGRPDAPIRCLESAWVDVVQRRVDGERAGCR